MLSLGAFVGGARFFAEISGAYEGGDLAYVQSPARFAGYLKRLRDDEPRAISRSIANRLLMLPADKRRATAMAMMSEGFWTGLDPASETRRALRRLVLVGLEDAVSRSPPEGGFWLLASKLRTDVAGFDATARSYLATSFLVSPREAYLAQFRLRYAVSVQFLFDEGLRRSMLRDAALVERTNPRYFRELQPFLPAT